MKKIVFTLLIILSCFAIVSCDALDKYFELPDTITVDGVEYKRAYIGHLYEKSYNFSDIKTVKIKNKTYTGYFDKKYKFFVASDLDAKPNIYFESSHYSEAVSYYDNSENYKYICHVGNVYGGDQYTISDIDVEMFDKLLEFSKKNAYNPLTSFNNEDGLEIVAFDSSSKWTTDEIRFYKESNDGAFNTSMGFDLKLRENKLYLLYAYDFEDEANPVMKLRAIPSDISNYFISLINQNEIIIPIP